MNWKFVLLIMSVTVIGCSETFTDHLEKPQITVERVEIGNFAVTIETPEDYAPHIYRDSFLEKAHFVSAGKSGFIVDKDVTPGELYTYRFGYVNSDKFIEQHKVDIKIPLDVLSSQFDKLPEHYFGDLKQKGGVETIEVENLVLEKGRPFSLSGTRAQVIVQNFNADDGELTSFLPTEEGPIGENGRSGGPLKIKILNGEGNFTLTMRGQKGGRGVEPKPLGESARGKTGPVGARGLYKCIISVGELCYCATPPGDGGKGEKSVQVGNSGTRGMLGGDSGELFLEISDTSRISYKIQREAGRGGDGSLGGLGGPGGFGGPPGEITHSTVYQQGPDGTPRKDLNDCPQAKQGPLGDWGDRGARGPEGNPGKLNRTCTRIIGDAFWKCEN